MINFQPHIVTYIFSKEKLLALESHKNWKSCRSDSKHELYWPQSGKCFNVTEQGPCADNEALVLRDDQEDPSLEAVCITQPCLRYSKINNNITTSVTCIKSCKTSVLFQNKFISNCVCRYYCFLLHSLFQDGPPESLMDMKQKKLN